MLQNLYSPGKYLDESNKTACQLSFADAKEERIKNSPDNLPKPKTNKKQLVEYKKLKLITSNNNHKFAPNKN